MEHQIIIKVQPNEVGIEFIPGHGEALPMDELRAMEMAIHAMAQRLVRDRPRFGHRVPGVYLALVEADAWRQVI